MVSPATSMVAYTCRLSLSMLSLMVVSPATVAVAPSAQRPGLAHPQPHRTVRRSVLAQGPARERGVERLPEPPRQPGPGQALQPAGQPTDLDVGGGRGELIRLEGVDRRPGVQEQRRRLSVQTHRTGEDLRN
jgi:hypothetical protein